MQTKTKFLFSLTAVLALAACGGDDSSSDASSTADTAAQTADSGRMAEVTAAIEATGYTCTPESFAMTSAAHESCLTTNSISVQAYTWADAATLTAEIDTEIMCSVDSTLGSIMSLRGDDWAVSAFSLSASTADKEAEITSALTAIQSALGGDITTSACG